MSRICQVTGRGTTTGNTYARRGLAKAKGGVGRKVTGKTKRQFKVNLIRKRIWVPELKRYVRVRISAKALKTISLKGAYPVLLEAGLVQPRQTKG